jgi:hypothetical protein
MEELIRLGHCKYCGVPAKTGSLSSTPFKGEEADLWCEACHEDLVEFDRQPENAIPDFPTGDEAALNKAVQLLADRESRLEKFMKQRVSDRKSKQ